MTRCTGTILTRLHLAPGSGLLTICFEGFELVVRIKLADIENHLDGVGGSHQVHCADRHLRSLEQVCHLSADLPIRTQASWEPTNQKAGIGQVTGMGVVGLSSGWVVSSNGAAVRDPFRCLSGCPGDFLSCCLKLGGIRWQLRLNPSSICHHIASGEWG